MPVRGRRGGRGWPRLIGRSVAYLLILAGLAALGGAGYLLYGTGVQVSGQQRRADAELDKAWQQDPQLPSEPMVGQPFVRIGFPQFGDSARYPVMEGIAHNSLIVGPGHYQESGLPGEPGNFAVAGYRSGYGAPFGHVDELKACDPIVVETGTDFFVYRVMPMDDQVADWDRLRAADRRCARVPSLRTDEPGGGPYGSVVGRRTLGADGAGAVASVPYRPQSTLKVTDQVSLLTLTTTYARNAVYSSADRQIAVHAVLTDQISKNGATGPDAYRRLVHQIGAD